MSEMVECDVASDDSIDALLAHLAQTWGKTDFLVHAIGFSDKNELRGRYGVGERRGLAGFGGEGAAGVCLVWGAGVPDLSVGALIADGPSAGTVRRNALARGDPGCTDHLLPQFWPARSDGARECRHSQRHIAAFCR